MEAHPPVLSDRSHLFCVHRLDTPLPRVEGGSAPSRRGPAAGPFQAALSVKSLPCASSSIQRRARLQENIREKWSRRIVACRLRRSQTAGMSAFDCNGHLFEQSGFRADATCTGWRMHAPVANQIRKMWITLKVIMLIYYWSPRGINRGGRLECPMGQLCIRGAFVPQAMISVHLFGDRKTHILEHLLHPPEWSGCKGPVLPPGYLSRSKPRDS
jgi:hypothetical protein